MTDKAKLPLWLIALGTGSAVMGITLITPALPVIVQELDVIPERVQLLLTAYLVTLATGQLIYGPLSDAFGRRVFFRIGAFLIFASGITSLFASDIFVLTACRAVQGLGAAACISMGRTMLNDHFNKEDASKAMASVQTIQAIVPMIALSSGGAIVYYTGWEGVMGLITLTGGILWVCSLTVLPETHISRSSVLKLDTFMQSYKAVLTNRLFWNFMLISSFQVGAFFTLNAFIPYAYDNIGTSSLAFGLWFGMTPVGYMFGNLFNRLYMVKKGIERAALYGCVFASLSLALLLTGQLASLKSPLVLALPCICFGFANGLTVANATIGGIGAARPNAGTASGLIGAFTMMIGAVGGVIVISLGADKSVITGIVCLMVMVLLSLISAIAINRTKHSSS